MKWRTILTKSTSERWSPKRIRAEVEPQHTGKFVVVDIETGEYEVDQSDLVATKRALAKRPDAVLYGLRIGYPTAYRLGGPFTVEQHGQQHS
jgi:hypothetical protein